LAGGVTAQKSGKSARTRQQTACTPVLSPSAMRALPISVARGDRLSLTQTDRELRRVAVVAAGGSRWCLKGTVSLPQSPAVVAKSDVPVTRE